MWALTGGPQDEVRRFKQGFVLRQAVLPAPTTGGLSALGAPAHLACVQGYEMACQVGVKCLTSISKTFGFSVENRMPLISTCMTTLSSKIVGRCKREMAAMCVDAVLAVADLERRDVNLDLIKVDGKVGAKTEDTRLVHGIVLDKDFSHPQMPKELTDVKVNFLCVHSFLQYHKREL